jgi:hypothetical protein
MNADGLTDDRVRYRIQRLHSEFSRGGAEFAEIGHAEIRSSAFSVPPREPTSPCFPQDVAPADGYQK